MIQAVPGGNFILRTAPAARYDLWRTSVPAMVEEDTRMLLAGEMGPDFAGETTSSEPFTLSLFWGKKVVLHFYPKDGPPPLHPGVHAWGV